MKRSRASGTTDDLWGALKEQAEHQLFANRRTETFEWIPPLDRLGVHDTPLQVTYSFPIPCQNATTVQESTSTLLAARAYAKAGRVDYAWDALESLFSVQATNGLLPKYRYSPSNDTNYFVNHTDIPNWSLYGNVSSDYLPPDTSLAHKLHVRSSGRLTALPLHATIVLDIFYLSNQTSNDLMHLQRNFDRLYRHYSFLHTTVMRGCPSNNEQQKQHDNNKNDTIPCYNVVHPWETIVNPESPLWSQALSQVHDLIEETGWTPPINNNTTLPYDSASLFLLECMSNATLDCSATLTKPAATSCEDEILKKCPFSILDVGYAAALVKADSDMIQIGRILQDEGDESAQVLKKKLLEWKQQSEWTLNKLLWNTQHETFLSQVVQFVEENHTLFVPAGLEWLEHAVADNLMGLWTYVDNATQRDALIFHMLEQQGDYSFDCGPYPLWATGGCDDAQKQATVSPLLNYLVSRGLQHNDDSGMAHYLGNSTLNLVCGLPNQVVHTNSSSTLCANVSFWRDYNGRTGLPVLTECGGDTVTAAVVYNLLVLDKPFHYTPAPPIRSSWVIVLVVAELVIAFSIGVSCLVLSVNLLRRLNSNNEGDAFVRFMENDTDVNYFSARGSFASLEEEEEKDEEGIE